MTERVVLMCKDAGESSRGRGLTRWEGCWPHLER